MCSFVFIGMSVTFSQEKAVTQPVQAIPSKSVRVSERAIPLSSVSHTELPVSKSQVESIDTRIALLEEEMRQNAQNKAYDRKASEAKLVELKSEKAKQSKTIQDEK